MAQVKIDSVNKKFDEVNAVNNFSLNIMDGEFIVLVGPSGCGKTTLLRMVAGLENVSSGEIYIDENLVTHVPPKKRDIAMVFQNYALYPHMNVYDNMAFALKLRKKSKDEIKQAVRAAACLLGIEDLLGRLPNQLSGGQKQRVALGRAIVRQPKVFLFDEPLSNLDAKLRISMRAELLLLHQRLNNTCIYVTHDQLEAMTMGTRIIIMKNGVVQQSGTPKEIYNHPANKFVAGFIGSPAMNFFPCSIKKKQEKLIACGPGMVLAISDLHKEILKPYVNREIILGVRPEHFNVLSAGKNENEDTRINTTVLLVEPLGAEQLIHLVQGEQGFVARIGPKSDVQSGQSLELKVDMDSANFFDAETEVRII